MRKRRVPLLLLDQFIADQKMAAQERDPDRECKLRRQRGHALFAAFLAALVGLRCVIAMLGDDKAGQRTYVEWRCR